MAQLEVFTGSNEQLSGHALIYDINLRMVLGYAVSPAEQRIQFDQMLCEFAMTSEEIRAYFKECDEEAAACRTKA